MYDIKGGFILVPEGYTYSPSDRRWYSHRLTCVAFMSYFETAAPAFSLSLRASAEPAPSRREPLTLPLLICTFVACSVLQQKMRPKGSLREGAVAVRRLRENAGAHRNLLTRMPDHFTLNKSHATFSRFCTPSLVASLPAAPPCKVCSWQSQERPAPAAGRRVEDSPGYDYSRRACEPSDNSRGM